MNTPFTIALVSSTLLLLAGHEQAFGQSSQLQRRLQAATRLECRFSALATTSWENGTPAASLAEAELETAFYDINIEEGTAEAEGRFGDTYIVARYTSGYMHFMQISDAGPLYLTTVIAQESADGRLIAVHIRHEYSVISLPGFTSRPEMYVGDCAVQTATP